MNLIVRFLLITILAAKLNHFDESDFLFCINVFRFCEKAPAHAPRAKLLHMEPRGGMGEELDKLMDTMP